MERLNVEKLPAEARSGYMESRGQDNVIASVKEPSASKMLPNNSFLGQASQNGRAKDPKTGFKSSMSSTQTSTGINSIPAIESKETSSAKSMVLGRRFNDSPAIVPIKKRRIQIIEAVRSPSPSPSPCPSPSPSLSAAPAPAPRFSPQTFPPHTVASPLYMGSPPGQSSTHDLAPSLMACSPNSLDIRRNQDLLASNEMEMLSRWDEEQEKQGIMRVEECQNVPESKLRNSLERYSEKSNKRSSQNVRENTDDLSPERVHVRSESSSVCRDDRLHWDLNMDMAAWDTNTDQDDIKNIECESAGSPDTSTSRASNRSSSHGETRMNCENADSKERYQVVKQKLVDHYNQLRTQECGQTDECSDMQQETPPFTRQTGWESEGAPCNARYGIRKLTSDLGEIHDQLEKQDHDVDFLKRGTCMCPKQILSDNANNDISGRDLFESEKKIKLEDNEDDIIQRALSKSQTQIRTDSAEGNILECCISKSEKQITVDDGEDDIRKKGFLKPGNHSVVYEILGRRSPESEKKIRLDGISDDIAVNSVLESEKQVKSEDAGVWNNISEEPEGEENVDYGDSDFRDVDEIGLDVDCKALLTMQAEGYSNSESGKHSLPVDEIHSDRDGSPSQASSHEDAASNEDHRKDTIPGRKRPTGWDQLPEGFDNPEEALKAAKEIAPRRGGRSTTWIASGGRGSNNSNRVGATPREGYSTARVNGVYYSERRPDANMNDQDEFSRGRRKSADGFGAHNTGTARGRNLGRREGFTGRGRGSGWVEGQGNPMNQWNRRQTPAFGGPTGITPARIGSSGFILAHDGNSTLQKPGNGIIGGGRGGMRPIVNRSGRGPLLQIGRGVVDMDVGMHYSMRAGNGPNGMTGGGRGLGIMHDSQNGSSSGRGLVDRYQSIRGGPLPQQSRRNESPRRSSSSSSSHRVDHHHSNVPNRMPSMRSESRIMRPRTSPSSYVPARNQHQRSPPPSSRWMVDKREGDGQRDRDMRRSSLSWPHGPQRTSPHVVHGSSLMDERDRQVLAVTRQSPPLLSKGIPERSSCLDARQQSSRGGEGGDEETEQRRHFGSKEPENYPSPRDDKDRYKAHSYRRDRERDMMVDIDDRRRDSHKFLIKDERSMSGDKHAIGRDADDDIAPRRRRHS